MTNPSPRALNAIARFMFAADRIYSVAERELALELFRATLIAAEHDPELTVGNMAALRDLAAAVGVDLEEQETP